MLSTLSYAVRRRSVLYSIAGDCPTCAGTGMVFDGIRWLGLCPQGCGDGVVEGTALGWEPEMRHPQRLVVANGHSAWVDEGVAGLIAALWAVGVETWASCQGPVAPSSTLNSQGYVQFPCDDLEKVLEVASPLVTVTKVREDLAGFRGAASISFQPL
jgi:hypothetical protein